MHVQKRELSPQRQQMFLCERKWTSVSDAYGKADHWERSSSLCILDNCTRVAYWRASKSGVESRACSAVCSACGVGGVPWSCAEGNCADTSGSGTHTSTARPLTAAGETPSAEAINRYGRSLHHVTVFWNISNGNPPNVNTLLDMWSCCC